MADNISDISAGGIQGDQSSGGAANGGDQLQADLEAANQKIQELTETAKRALADLQNYRKRTDDERAAFAAFASAGLILELLPILDSFNRAFANVPDLVSKTDWFKGALQIEQQLAGVIRKQGVIEIPAAVGQKFDPKLHEPLTVGSGEKDIVVEEFEKGYLLGEKVLRPTKVKVGDGSK